MPLDRSISASSTCSSLAGSSQESDEVFSDLEEKSSPSKKKVLRKVSYGRGSSLQPSFARGRR